MTAEESAAPPPAAPGPGPAEPMWGALHAVGEALQRGRQEDAVGGTGSTGGTEPEGATGSDPGVGLAAACQEAGRSLAEAGVPLGESLDALAAEWGSVMGGDPRFAAVRTFADAWGDGTLAWLRRLDCTDPLTGLATPGHLRTRVAEVLRANSGAGPESDQQGVGERGAGEPRPVLVVAELSVATGEPGPGPRPLVDALLATRVGAMVRAVFPRAETVASLGGARLALLADEGPGLARRVRLLEQVLATMTEPTDPTGTGGGFGEAGTRVPRVHVLPVPVDPGEAQDLLDGLLTTRAHTGVARGWPPGLSRGGPVGDAPGSDTLAGDSGGEVADTA